jgi:DNA-binding transcriptional ArsR family regulator
LIFENAKAFLLKRQIYFGAFAIKQKYNPNAYLREVKNVKEGLTARTRLLNFLEKKSANAKSIADSISMPYNSVLHHLRLLETEDIVARKGRRPFVWFITGLGQRRLHPG